MKTTRLSTPLRDLLFIVGTTCLSSCVAESMTWSERHCASEGNDGNAWCVATHGAGYGYCTYGVHGCPATEFGDGCTPTRPADECYSPCGDRTSVADAPEGTCASPTTTTSSTVGTEETMTTSTTSSSSSTTDVDPTTTSEGSSESTSEETTSTGPASCVSSEDCTSPEAPHCDDAGTCVSCSEAPDPDAACAAMDPTVPLCFEGSCTACTNDNPGACEGDTPACLDGECVECTPDDTTACDDERPVCGETNTCVPCNENDLGTCAGETPLCIEETCQPCVAHAECPAGEPSANGAACDFLTGACFPQTAVWHVDGDDGCTDAPDGGTDELSLCTMGEALERASVEGSGTIILHELDGDLSYVAASGITVPANLRVAILAADDEAPRLQGSGGNPGLRVEEGATAYLRGLSISGNQDGNGVEVLGTVVAENVTVAGNTGVGVLVVESGRVEADVITVENNTGVGVLVLGSGRLEASRCSITSNTDGGVRLGEAEEDPENTDGSSSSAGTASSGGGGLVDASSATALLENCMVVQLSNSTDAVAIYGGSATILYSTLAASFGGRASALRCDDGGNVSVRNSLFVSLSTAPEVVCTLSSAEYSAAEVDLGDSNTMLPAMEEDSEWFVDFGSGDLHLDDPPTALLTAARWRTGDPRIDIDGDARPTMDDAPDVAGADRAAR